MQERQHVKTTPGEPKAVPEYTPHPVRKQEGHDVQMDDINIPLVAVTVAFFAVLLAVTIVSLQAWFYHQEAAERKVKTYAQDDTRTELGARLAVQRDDLYHEGITSARTTTPAATAPATGQGTTNTSAEAPRKRMPIDWAIDIVSREEMAAARGGGAPR